MQRRRITKNKSFQILVPSLALAICAWTSPAFGDAAQDALERIKAGQADAATLRKAREEGFQTRNNKYGTNANRFYLRARNSLQVDNPMTNEVAKIKAETAKIRAYIEKLKSGDSSGISVVRLASTTGNPENCEDIQAEANQGIIANSVQIGGEQEEKRDDGFEDSSSDDREDDLYHNNQIGIGVN